MSCPGHVLMKLPVTTGEIIIDPFNGTSLSREELEERLEPYLAEHVDEPDMPLSSYLQPAPSRDILARMLRNLKSLFHDQARWHDLLPVQKRLAILLPDDITEVRDRGLTYARLDRAQEALPDLEAYLLERPYAPDAKALRSQVGKLRRAGKPVN
jgi:regulator of sirC expression with transglutaminase-like and TPR domain